jgi:ubiquinone/menaquinone biosynthesis C-methylase UbiE
MHSTDRFERQPHVAIDLASRRLKALKIERLLGLQRFPQPIRVLEIGCGSGGIAHYFATHSSLQCSVTAVDVHDNRQIHEGYVYQNVQGVQLPFADQQFDAVISNHVIEHVGDTAAQLEHLREIRRVLTCTGQAYLAVPNRWMVTEPHYHLKFLSWLPHEWRSPYLRWMGKGHVYDCEPLQMRQLERMLEAADLQYCNQCVEGWRVTFEIERPTHWSNRVLTYCPDALLQPLSPIIPTLIYQLRRSC